ncbi:MAG TPA: NAD-dependent epimerase/dehydratase family protein [Acetobacteraceae bacterium]|nr:NAD-dependent epimerase/dehydratase family protein [Acetobacteraceae bacterium]
MRRVGLVGAGFISRVHAEALRTVASVELAAVVDPVLDRARSLAAQCAIPHVFSSVQEALTADAFDCAHVLVPPDRHAATAALLIAGGKPVLIEKPLADSGAACAALIEQATALQVPIGINQNFVHHPAFVRLRGLLQARALGRPNHISCIYNVPLRQITARQFGHWMFAAPGNLLLEQAVHPLSQIVALAGTMGDVLVRAGPPLAVAPGQVIYPTLDAVLAGEHLPATLRFAVGQAFPLWQLSVVCDDGVATADILGNRLYTSQRTRWLETLDGVASASRTATAMVGDSARNAAGYGMSLLRLASRNDPFFRSMRDSIAAFHAALDAGRAPELGGRFGAGLVNLCERIGDLAFTPPRTELAAPIVVQSTSAADIAVLGGTGFIGSHLVRHCLDKGLRVAVMARSIRGLPELFRDPRVRLHRGDIGDADAIADAIIGTPAVVNLAHGGGGGSWDEIREAMVGGAETVAHACLRHNVQRLVHVGSIASLYLGPQPGAVTGSTPPDRQADRRADYARAKAICDRMLLELHASQKLPVVILRPGVVVGEGGPPFHGGLGFFNNEQHCIGWNDGRNPLPFVLVEDVAEAVLLAIHAENVDGRCYNLVGDVRLSARAYIAALGTALQRPLHFHPQSPLALWAGELGKWAIKRAGGRHPPVPSLRDLLSRGMKARFDCTDARRDLDWHPVSDREIFEARAISVHAG